MPFIILAYDKPDTERLRADLRPQHIAYLSARQGQMLAGGAVLDATARRLAA